MRFDFGLSFGTPAFAPLHGPCFPGSLVSAFRKSISFVDTFFVNAPKMPHGSLTALYVADRVMELVLGGYAIAVATAILPMMAHQAAANDFEGLKRTFTFAIRIVAYITIPAAIGLMVLREPIIRMLFQHGQFVAESTRLTARPLLYYAVGLPALACVKLIVPAFYSARDTKTPVIVAAISFLLNIALNFLFLQPIFLNVSRMAAPRLPPSWRRFSISSPSSSFFVFAMANSAPCKSSARSVKFSSAPPLWARPAWSPTTMPTSPFIQPFSSNCSFSSA